MKKISNAGIEFISSLEGIKLNSYQDIGGIWTIGIGTTIVNGHTVKSGMSCTKEQAYGYFKEHLEKFVYPIIENYVHVPLTQNQFDALCSFIYNVGENNFKNSTLLLLLNELKYKEASEQFKKWNKAKGKVVSGLTDRRKKEYTLFNS